MDIVNVVNLRNPQRIEKNEVEPGFTSKRSAKKSPGSRRLEMRNSLKPMKPRTSTNRKLRLKQTAKYNWKRFQRGNFRSRFGSEKALLARNILEINLLRLLGAKIGRFDSNIEFPPSGFGISYGLVDSNGKVLSILNETHTQKSETPKYRFNSLEERIEFQNNLSIPTQEIYTDGSYYRRYQISGYAVWWGHDNPNNGCGPVPTNGPLSSVKAEEYAIFLALLQIRAEVSRKLVSNKKYVILTDSLMAKLDIARWFRRWNKSQCAVGWKTPVTTTTEHREILRVAAGLLWDLRFRDTIVTIRHVKGHSGIVGNEIADLMAKFGSRSGRFLGPQPALIESH